MHSRCRSRTAAHADSCRRRAQRPQGGDACECVRQHDRVSYRVNDGLRSVSSRRLASCDAEQSFDVGGDDASPCHLDELGVDAVDRGGRLAGGRRESHSCGSVWTHPIHAH